jgi:hypothetical protein
MNFMKPRFKGRKLSMNLWKYGIVFVVLCILICTSFSASAVSFSDPIGDVHYGNASDNYGKIDNRPNVDITQLSVTVKGNRITLSITVAGGIQISDDVMYTAYINSTDTRYTMLLNNNDYIMGASVNRSSGVYEYANDSVTVSGDTLSVVFNLHSSASMETIYGLTQERERTQSGLTGDLWFDNAKFAYTTNSTDSDVNTTNNTDGNNTNGDTGTLPGEKTPGFEILPVIVAITITVILLRRRR